MIWALISAGGIIALIFMALIVALMCAAPSDSLDEQAECIRKDMEARKEKKRRRAEKRQRRRARWANTARKN